MKNAINKNKIFILIGLIFTLLVLLFDTLNVSNLSIETKTSIGAIGIFLSILSSGYKQYFDPKINDVTLWIQALLFFAYVSGGLLDKFNLLPLNDEWKSILRIVLTFIVNSVPIVIKTLSTEEKNNQI
jgi:ABC-type multidrug transport system permease subunit